MDPRVDLAALRTELAWGRTLLSWLRTGLALMGAGVAFDKGTQLLHQARVLTGTALVRNGHLVGLTLTGVSTLLLFMAVFAQCAWTCADQRRQTSAILTCAAGFGICRLLGGAVFIVLFMDQR